MKNLNYFIDRQKTGTETVGPFGGIKPIKYTHMSLKKAIIIIIINYSINFRHYCYYLYYYLMLQDYYC